MNLIKILKSNQFIVNKLLIVVLIFLLIIIILIIQSSYHQIPKNSVLNMEKTKIKCLFNPPDQAQPINTVGGASRR